MVWEYAFKVSACRFVRFQFQFGWFGSFNNSGAAAISFAYFNSSLDGLGDEATPTATIDGIWISIPVWMVWEQERFTHIGVIHIFQFQFGWFGRQSKNTIKTELKKFQFQFGWFGRFLLFELYALIAHFNSSLDGLGAANE